MAGWPAYNAFCRDGEPNHRLGDHIFDEANLRDFDLALTFSVSRVEGGDPLSVALEFAGAAMVP